MTNYPLLTAEQLRTLESQLAAAEQELRDAAQRGASEPSGPATRFLKFKATEYIRRLLEDVKSYRIGRIQ